MFTCGFPVCMVHTALRALALLPFLIAYLPSQAHAQETVGVERIAGAETKRQSAVGNLVNIQQSIESKRNAIIELRKQLKLLEDPTERQETEQKIERYKSDIQELQRSFEYIVLGGINLSVLADEPDQRMDWRVELEEIIRPLLSTLKEITAKPRQVDGLRRAIEQREDQLKIIAKALDSINTIRQMPATPEVSGALDQMLVEWEQRKDDTQRELEISRFRLGDLESVRTPWRTSAGEALAEFLRGRGLTLLLAVVASLVVWMIARGLLALYWRWLYRTRSDIGITRAPLVLYGYRLVLATSIVAAIILVLYVRGDVLLLTLAVIALAGFALSLRQTLPRYAAELRLLLGIGPVRERERLVLENVPYDVESLGIYTVLRNPALEGVIRLPLHDMNALASRPASAEPWFPCEPGDYLQLADGSFGKVLRQTVELVEVAVRDTTVLISTKDFLGQSHRNLSRNGFGIACTFGIDYRHQAISLDTVPRFLQEAIIARFTQGGLGKSIREILVEFKEAGASSLDYQIYLILDGQAAKAFFRAQRMVQQACVDCCNREGWVIPFTQITIHTIHDAEGHDGDSENRSAGTAGGITTTP